MKPRFTILNGMSLVLRSEGCDALIPDGDAVALRLQIGRVHVSARYAFPRSFVEAAQGSEGQDEEGVPAWHNIRLDPLLCFVLGFVLHVRIADAPDPLWRELPSCIAMPLRFGWRGEWE